LDILILSLGGLRPWQGRLNFGSDPLIQSPRRPPTEIEGLGQNLDEPPSDSATGRRSGWAVRRQFAFR